MASISVSPKAQQQIDQAFYSVIAMGLGLLLVIFLVIYFLFFN